MTDRTIRVVVAKPGLDGHDRGAKIVARALRDAGFYPKGGFAPLPGLPPDRCAGKAGARTESKR